MPLSQIAKVCYCPINMESENTIEVKGRAERKNIFQLWRENGEVLPFNVVLNSWDPTKRYAEITAVDIKKWPYGNAMGQYFIGDQPGHKSKIRNAGSFTWSLKDSKDTPLKKKGIAFDTSVKLPKA